MIFFRADASQEMGFGRLARTIYLSSLLKKSSRSLFCIKKDKIASRLLQSKGIQYCLHKELGRLNPQDYKALVFDSSHFEDQDREFLNQAMAQGIPTYQFLEPGQEPLPANHFILPGIEPVSPSGFGGKWYSGPQYVALHHKFRHFNKVLRRHRKRVKYIFLALGSTVDYRSLRAVIDMLTRHGFRLKIAPGFTFKSSVPKILKRIYPSIRFVGQPESLARSFFEADLALVTPGTGAFEAAAVGTPALYLPLHKRQDAQAKFFEEKGLGLNLYQMGDTTETLLLDKIASLTQERRIAMGTTGKELVDGLGANRVISLLSSL